MNHLFASRSPLRAANYDEDMSLGSSGDAHMYATAVLQQPLSFGALDEEDEFEGLGGGEDAMLDPAYERLLPSLDPHRRHAPSNVDTSADGGWMAAGEKRRGALLDEEDEEQDGGALFSTKQARVEQGDDDDIIVTTGFAPSSGLPVFAFHSMPVPGSAQIASSPVGWAASAARAPPAPSSAPQHHPAHVLLPAGASSSSSRVTRSVTATITQQIARPLSTISEESERSSLRGSATGGSSLPSRSSPRDGGGSASGHPASPRGSLRGSMDEGEEDEEGAYGEEDASDDGGSGAEGRRGPTTAEGRAGASAGEDAGGEDEHMLVVLPRPLAASLGRKGRIPFALAYPRGKLATGCAYSVGMYGVNNGQRGSRLAALAALRARRIFFKKVKYTQRHQLANGRQRVKGRFVKDDTPGAAQPKAAGKAK